HDPPLTCGKRSTASGQEGEYTGGKTSRRPCERMGMFRQGLIAKSLIRVDSCTVTAGFGKNTLIDTSRTHTFQLTMAAGQIDIGPIVQRLFDQRPQIPPLQPYIQLRTQSGRPRSRPVSHVVDGVDNQAKDAKRRGLDLLDPSIDRLLTQTLPIPDLPSSQALILPKTLPQLRFSLRRLPRFAEKKIGRAHV